MLPEEQILIDISLISCSPGWTNITELWNIISAFYLYHRWFGAENNTEYQHSRKLWRLSAITQSNVVKKLIAYIFLFSVLIPLHSQAQDYKKLVITKGESRSGIQSHYQYQCNDGHFCVIDLWLFTNKNFEYRMTSNVFNGFSKGGWTLSKNTLKLVSTYKEGNLPIKVFSRKRDTTDTGINKIAFVRNSEGHQVDNVFVDVNVDSVTCLYGDGICNSQFDKIERIRVRYENSGPSSQWIEIKPFEGILQIVVESNDDLEHYLIFDPKTFQIINQKLRSITP
jgi:hypothetical protein